MIERTFHIITSVGAQMEVVAASLAPVPVYMSFKLVETGCCRCRYDGCVDTLIGSVEWDVAG